MVLVVLTQQVDLIGEFRCLVTPLHVLSFILECDGVLELVHQRTVVGSVHLVDEVDMGLPVAVGLQAEDVREGEHQSN